MHLRSSSLACAFAVVALVMTSSGLAEAIAQPLNSSADSSIVRYFIAPIDAISAHFDHPSTDTLDVSAWNGKSWTSWQSLHVDSDVDEHETTLMFFDPPTTKIRLRGSATSSILHPITVTSHPASYKVASLTALAGPHILSRAEWGADDSFLFTAPASSSASNSSAGSNETVPTASTQRVSDCQAAQRNYPDQFTVQRTVTQDAKGRTFRWPVQYSKKIDLIIVHHTALEVQKTSKSAVERMRALYAYHANSLGWGDVGYNYVIDETGQIYEGKYGGRFVVGGHAYCNNINTLGISLMGNFELEQPTQKQVQALQWLVQELSQEYGIKIGTPVSFHGKDFSSRLIRHRDVLSTACPGYYLATAFPQVVANVVSGNIGGSVKFPDLPPVIDVTVPETSSSSQSSEPKRGEGVLVPVAVTQQVKELKASGGTDMRLNPGGVQRFDLVYTAPSTGVRSGSRIAQVVRSSPAIGILQDTDDGRSDVRGALVLPQSLASGEEYRFELVLTAPVEEGNFWFEIGGIRYTFKTSGRRSRLIAIPQSFNIFTSPTYDVPLTTRSAVKNRLQPMAVRSSSLSSSSVSRSAFAPVQRPVVKPLSRAARQQATIASSSSSLSVAVASPLIRIRLSLTAFPVANFTTTGVIGGRQFLQGDSIVLRASGNACQAVGNSNFAEGDVLRMTPDVGSLIHLNSVRGKPQTYRGVIECRIIDGQVALINELPLEDYMKGLAEEGDSQPMEKQKAFAVAARSYAVFYLSPNNRKYLGKPYDGDDSPASFQSYLGYDFEQRNARWVLAVNQTAGKVLKKNGEVIKTPYFSSDDGRTRSIAESTIKIKYPEIYDSKPDPWCKGMKLSGHGVGMSGCGALGQANAGRTYDQILQYYYPTTSLDMYVAHR